MSLRRACRWNRSTRRPFTWYYDGGGDDDNDDDDDDDDDDGSCNYQS